MLRFHLFGICIRQLADEMTLISSFALSELDAR